MDGTHGESVNIALRRSLAETEFLRNHGNFATEGSPKIYIYALLFSNNVKSSL